MKLALHPDHELRELTSYGIVVGAPRQRPLLLLKGATEGEVLPVWLSPVEATLAVSGSQPANHGTSLGAFIKVLEMLKARILSCEFVELNQGHQYVDLVLETSSGVQRLRARADESMAICLASRTKFFATRDFMERSRARQADQVDILLTMGGEGGPGRKGSSVLLN